MYLTHEISFYKNNVLTTRRFTDVEVMDKFCTANQINDVVYRCFSGSKEI